MAQTPRTFAQHETELADNVAKEISPLDLRNLMASVLGCYGAIYTENGSTAEALTGVLALVNTWLSNGLSLNTTPDIGNNQLTIDAEGIYEVSFHCQYLGATGADEVEFELQNNLVAVAGFRAQTAIVVGARDSASFRNLVSLSSGDDLTIFARAVGAAGDITIENAQLVAKRVG